MTCFWARDVPDRDVCDLTGYINMDQIGKEAGLTWCMPDLGRLPVSVQSAPPVLSYCFRRRSFESMSYAILIACRSDAELKMTLRGLVSACPCM